MSDPMAWTCFFLIAWLMFICFRLRQEVAALWTEINKINNKIADTRKP